MASTRNLTRAVTVKARLAAIKALTEHVAVDRYLAQVLAAHLDELLHELVDPTVVQHIAVRPIIAALHDRQDDQSPT